ncbi:related to alpha-mannosidase [Serendipita indica DSM 11827]|uniref:alpha-1,2-Mannosidase n=1 Tax=Serendipita indica (strain DSM 11827) TaxID=1109443 RepID=G4U2B4_SERID|nr:related to alpha-mannosidase [Serendipita indica DSM 11827]
MPTQTTPLQSSTTRRRTNKLTKKPPSSRGAGNDKGSNAFLSTPLGNLIFWLSSVILVLGALALVPGPVQDRILVAIGNKDEQAAGDFPTKTKIQTDRAKRAAIYRAFEHAWFGYERHAFGADEYHPLSQTGSNLTMAGSVGYTVIDSLSTMLLFSLSEDGASIGPSYKRARKWLKEEHTFDVDADYNTFELTIRLLGGLLSAHWAEYEIGITPGRRSIDDDDEEVDISPTNLAGDAQSVLRKARKRDQEDDYDPSDMLYLHKAVDLADRLMHAFETRSGLPLSYINLKTRKASKSDQENGLASTAEVGTLQLEFRYLSHVLANQLYQIPPNQLSTLEVPSFLKNEDGEIRTIDELRSYWNVVEGVIKVTKEGTMGRLPSVFINPDDGEFIISPIRLGSRGDSYFEYLLKQFLQTDKREPELLRLWDDAIDQIHTTLEMRTPRRNLLYIAELNPEKDDDGQITWRREPKQDHLACFLAGSLMLGAAHTRGKNGKDVPIASVPPKLGEFEDGGRAMRDWRMGEDMLRGCYETHKTKTGLAPEIIHFRTKTEPQWITDKAEGEWYIRGAPPPAPPPIDARYILRPEIIESIFIAYRLTADPKYRRWGWQIFESIEEHCMIPTGGYAGVRNVDHLPVEHEDKMETFFLSETLKYLYLLFSDDSVLPLEDIVFNTEAHPFPRFVPDWDTAFM